MYQYGLAGMSKYWECICMYWLRVALFRVRVQRDNWAFNCWLSVTTPWRRPPGTTDRKKASCGGPATALPTVLATSKAKIGKCCTSSSPVQGSGLCQCPACWDVCLWYQLVILAPFSTECKAGWIRAILGVNVTMWLSLELEAHCSTSILGPWSFPLTILQNENPNTSSLLAYQQ